MFYAKNKSKEKIKMNICFLIGRIVSEIQFEFILSSKRISIAIFKLKLSNESIIEIQAYDEIADYCYRNLKIGYKISIYGSIKSNIVLLKEIYNKY